MGQPGEEKYITVHKAITDAQLAAHILGEQTHAIKLIWRDGLARAWVVELDEGGVENVRRYMDVLSGAGLPCFAVAGKGSGGHDGGHIWGVYAEGIEPAAAKAQIVAILTAAGLPIPEIWPQGNHIRAPFGRHTWTDTRGTLLRPGLPDEPLDTPDGLALGLDTLETLACSPTPPPLPKAEPRPITPRTIATTDAPTPGCSFGELVAWYNARNPIADLLSSYGARRLRGDEWACNCGIDHEHTTQIAVTAQGNAVFFSPRCRWAEGLKTDRNGRLLADSFALAANVEHQGRRGDLAKAIRAAHQSPAQQRDAQRKRDARAAENAATLQSVYDRAAEDTTLTPCDREVLHALLHIADGRISCRPSKIRIAQTTPTGYSVGSVKRSLMRLESRGYFVSAGDGGTLGDTAIRTFVCGSSKVVNDPHKYIRASEGGAFLPVRDPSDPPAEAWDGLLAAPAFGCELLDVPNTELVVLRACDLLDPGAVAAQADGDPLAERPEHRAPVDGLCDVPADELPPTPWDVEAWQAAPASPAPAAEEAEELADEARILAYRAQKAAQPPHREPEAVAFEGGCSFDPGRRVIEPFDLAAHWRGILATAPSAEEQTYICMETPAEAPRRTPGPPASPEGRARFYSLQGKIKKSRNPAQRYALRRELDAITEWRTPEEWQALRAPSPPRVQQMTLAA